MHDPMRTRGVSSRQIEARARRLPKIALDGVRGYQKHRRTPAMPTSHEIHIREAVDADGPALAAMIAAIFAEFPGVRFLETEFPELAAPASHFRARGGRLLVAAGEAGIVASFGVVPTHDASTAEFLKVYAARSIRGQGVARRLYSHALDAARAMGAERISLWSDVKFLDGHRFYLRQGFARGPGVRALHDASETLELNFRLDPIPAAVPEPLP
jgi:putative acetyltransferase